MRPIIAMIMTLACAAPSVPVAKPPGIPAAENLAKTYARAVDPGSTCIDWGTSTDGTNDAALCRSGGVLFYCATSTSRHTQCQQLADTNPKPASQPPAVPPVQVPSAPSSPSPADAKPALGHVGVPKTKTPTK